MGSQIIMLIPKKVSRKNPSQAFVHLPQSEPRTVQDFWSWAYSDLLQNTTRGVLAEYIVAVLLGIDDTPRMPWDAYDLRLEDGTTVEVKTMSLLQGWAQKQLSSPRIVIGPTRAWDPQTSTMEIEPTFNAELYIFCYFQADSHDTAEPLDLDQWAFYVLPRSVLIEVLGNRKSITLKHLEKHGIIPLTASELANTARNSRPAR
jgi:hypothetical protein